MIALCPECKTRYRLAREKVGPQGARIRCSRCKTVFRVQPPKPAEAPGTGSASEAPVPSAHPRPEQDAAATKQMAPPQLRGAPPVRPAARALVAEADDEMAKRIVNCLARRKVSADVVSNGGEALLRMFRQAPDVAILGGHLPGVSAPVIAEIARRADELRIIPLVRIAPMDEPAGTPEFDASEVLEPGGIGSELDAALQRLSIGEQPRAEGDTGKLPVELPKGGAAGHAPPTSSPVRGPAEPSEPVSREAAPGETGSGEPHAPRVTTPPPSSDDPSVVSAERLARIAVSDIILYNEEKFAKAVKEGDVVAGLQAELAEARHLFEQRIPQEVRAMRDFLVEELQRRAGARAG